jgi:hypothetical protein
MTDEETKAHEALKAQLSKAHADIEDLKKSSTTPEEKKELASVRAQLAKLETDLAEAKKTGAGTIPAVSEASVHALLEKLKDVEKLVAAAPKKERIPLSPW